MYQKREKRLPKWSSIRARVMAKLYADGRRFCELRINDKCTPNFNLTPAHSKKMDDQRTLAEREEVCIACVNCHRNIEYGDPNETYKQGEVKQRMYRMVREAIQRAKENYD